MKLVNPAGRGIEAFATEVNRCRCICISDDAWSSAAGSSRTGICACNCRKNNSDNLNANFALSHDSCH